MGYLSSSYGPLTRKNDGGEGPARPNRGVLIVFLLICGVPYTLLCNDACQHVSIQHSGATLT